MNTMRHWRDLSATGTKTASRTCMSSQMSWAQRSRKQQLTCQASAKPAVVITGASTGIGKTTALYLAEKGWQVFAGVRSDAAAAELAAAGAGIQPVLLDVTKPESVSSALQQVQQQLGAEGLSGLINNAGKGVIGPLEHMPMEELASVMDVNLLGVARVTQAFLPLIRTGTPGRIVNIGSQAGTVSLPLFSPYSCSKFAVEALSDSLRYELAGQGIKVVLLKPGAVKTPIWDKSLEASEAVVGSLPEEGRRLYGELIKQVRAGSRRAESKGVAAQEVAQVIYEALTVEQPRARYLIGKEARLQMLFRRLLPDRMWDPLLMNSLSKMG